MKKWIFVLVILCIAIGCSDDKKTTAPPVATAVPTITPTPYYTATYNVYPEPGTNASLWRVSFYDGTGELLASSVPADGSLEYGPVTVSEYVQITWGANYVLPCVAGCWINTKVDIYRHIGDIVTEQTAWGMNVSSFDSFAKLKNLDEISW